MNLFKFNDLQGVWFMFMGTPLFLFRNVKLSQTDGTFCSDLSNVLRGKMGNFHSSLEVNYSFKLCLSSLSKSGNEYDKYEWS